MGSNNIIALFARGREIGYAVMREGQLRRWGVKTIRGKRHQTAFAKKVEKALASVFALAPNGLIVSEQIRDTPHQGALCRVLPEVLKRWERQGFRVRYLSLWEVKENLCGNRKATQSELVEAVTDRYPPLQSLITGATIEGGRKYWQKVFVAMGLILQFCRLKSSPCGDSCPGTG